jgi:hypothetical protein
VPPPEAGEATVEEVAPEEVAEEVAEEAPPPAVEPVWATAARPEEGLAGLAVWTAAGERPWLLAAAAASHRLILFDAASGGLLRELGSAGERPGQFREPVAVGVAGDLAFVAERGNGRVQMLRLPGLSTVGFLGAGELTEAAAMVVRVGPGGEVGVVVAEGSGALPRRLVRFVVVGDGTVLAQGNDAATGIVQAAALAGAAGAGAAPCGGGGPWWVTPGEEVLFVHDGGTSWTGRFRLAEPAPAGAVAVAGTALPLPGLPEGALYALGSDGSIRAVDPRDLRQALAAAAGCDASP